MTKNSGNTKPACRSASDAEAVGLDVEEGVLEAVLLELSVAVAEEEAVLVPEAVQLGVEVRDPVLLPV